MKRSDFIKKALLTGAAASLGPRIVHAKKEGDFQSTYDRLRAPIGFNHLPNKEEITMNTVLHKADTRGHADHGWLKSHHTFSFANYYNPERVHFGALRVLNDDTVAGGRGFNTHPHDNMEIISIPLAGDLEHKDSMGTVSVIREGDVQAMSAGTGVFHSEYNKNKDQEVKFLQIWVFPREKNVEPRYDQISVREVEAANKFYQILSPNPDDQGVWINQDAWFNLGKFEAGASDRYRINRKENGVYAFVLEGNVTIEGQSLNARDGFGIWNTDEISVQADSKARVLLMEVPMNLS
ncbi:MAG: pirin family protein [Bacteroidota bacterium]